MKTEASIDIDRPIEEVFTYTTTKVEEWSNIVEEDEVIEDVNGGDVGTTFRTVTLERGRTMEFDGEVIENDPPHLHAVRMVGDQCTIHARYTFEDVGGRTRVSQASVVEAKGFWGFVFKAFGSFMKKAGCRALEEELESLKRNLESGSA